MGKQAKEEMTEEEMVVLEGDEEDVEGVGREAEQGGEVHPSGGTDTSLAAAAPTLQVQHPIKHAVQVSQGRASPPIPPSLPPTLPC